MESDRLIMELSRDLKPISGEGPLAILGRSLVMGALIASCLVLFWPSLGVRPDLLSAAMTSALWIKLLYTASIAAIGFVSLGPLSRPEAATFSWAQHFGPPVALLAGMTAVRWLELPGGELTAFWMGASWWQCPLYVSLLSVPVYFGLVRSLTRLAPTRLGTTGAVAGLVAGATSASIYALHCAETSPGFVIVWYSLGLGIAALLGAVAGPRLLRW